MFHILDKTYLQYSSDFLFGVDCIQIEDIEANEVGYDSDAGKLLSGNVSERLFYSRTVEDLFASVKSHDSIFKHFVKRKGTNDSDKLVIYCDQKAYKTFSTKWLKTLMPHADVDTLVQVYSLYRSNELYNTKSGASDVQIRSGYASYWMGNAEAKAVFEKTEPFVLTIDYKKYCSAEFQLATYLVNPSSKPASTLMEKAFSLAQVRLLEEMDIIKSDIEQSLFNIDLLYPELGNVDFYNLHLAKILKVKPELNFIGQRTFTSYSNLQEFRKDYRVESVLKVCLDYLGWMDAGHELPLVISDFVDNQMSSPEPEAVIKRDLDNTQKRGMPPYFGILIQEGKINIYLYSYIADLALNNDKTRLEKLSLE